MHKKEIVVGNVENIVEGLEEGVKPLLEAMFSLDSANALLVSVLVKHLADEGVINLDKYLESNQHYEELLKSGYSQEGAESETAKRDVMMIEKIFTGHRSDLTKPE